MLEKKKLLELIKSFERKKIVVWGDFILDEYIYGRTSRVSREAPVLIIKHEASEFNLGGGANSIKNIKALKGEPIPVGIIGDDEAGERLLSSMEKSGITTRFIIKTKKYKTPIKTRIFAGGEHTRRQQVLRVDREERIFLDEDLKNSTLKNLLDTLNDANALLISDYDNWAVDLDVFEKIINKIRNEIPVTVDSRHRLLKFKNVSIATPNEPEVEEALHTNLGEREEILFDAGKKILSELNSSALLITRGCKGMCLFEKGKEPLLIPIYGSEEIVDVTGAGDTVISTVSLSLASGGSFVESAILANLAGGIVVMKRGAATLTPEELEEAVISEFR